MQMYSKFEGCPPVLLVALELKGCEYVHKLVFFVFCFLQNFNFKSPLVLNFVLFFFQPLTIQATQQDICFRRKHQLVETSDFCDSLRFLDLASSFFRTANTTHEHVLPANCSRFCQFQSHGAITASIWRLKTFVA